MSEPSNHRRERDAAYWARSRNTLRLSGVPVGAVSRNVEGRRAVGPLQGFGQLWKKTYTVRLAGAQVTPAEVIAVWKAEFPRFWERGNRFFAPESGLAAGDVVLINNPAPGGARISTGLLVLYADDESFTFMTPEGHPFSGWVTCSAFAADGATVAQIELLARANDPLYELGMPLGLDRAGDRTWRHTLESLAAHFGGRGQVEITSECVDPKRQWSRIGNIRHNAILGSALDLITAPFRRRREAVLTLDHMTPGASVSGVVLQEESPAADVQRRPPRDAANWARSANVLRVTDVPAGAVNLNVEGRRVVGALQGFGQLWRRTYQIRLRGAAVTPVELVTLWKARFAELNPAQSRFYPPLEGVAPGEVLIINASMSGMPVHTGVRVIYADDESFTVMTPEGHPESGWNTFSAHTDDDGETVAQIQSLARATDPIYELGFRLFGAKAQERIWTHVLQALAAQLGVNDGTVTIESVCIDSRLQWSRLGNLWYNAGIRSVVYLVTRPLRWLRRRLGERLAAQRRGHRNVSPAALE